MAENNEKPDYTEREVIDEIEDEGDTITLGEILEQHKEMEEVLNCIRLVFTAILFSMLWFSINSVQIKLTVIYFRTQLRFSVDPMRNIAPMLR